MRLRRTSCVIVLAAVTLGAGFRGHTHVDVEIRELVQQLARNGRLRLGQEIVRVSPALLSAYEQNGFQPYWTESRRLAQLQALIAEVTTDGLEPNHYHAAALTPERDAALRAAELDVLLTDALVRLVHDVTVGKTQDHQPNSDVAALMTSSNLYADFQLLRPRHFVYRGLRAALLDLRRINDIGGWPGLPPTTRLAPDTSHALVRVLRHRLEIEGYRLAAAADSNYFDAALATAVRQFQHRHGLNEDGTVGAATLAELNVPVATRIDQLRVNLERARWVVRELPDTFVVVNIAGAKVYLLRGANVAFETRAIVGKSYTRTPVFAATIQHIELNPTWTVPPGIVDEVLRLVRRDRSYLSRVNMRVVDASGRARNPATINFAGYTARTFPFTFVQAPGPYNPLGRIKFVFPNRYNVYLHDTPTRELFEQEVRTFSHGCIRVQNPVHLAELIMQDTAWHARAFYKAIDSDRLQRVPLKNPIPIRVLYWTASADLHGELHYYKDVYRRDAAVLADLRKP